MTASRISIFKKDCIAGMRKLESGGVALVFADPPYNLSGESMVNKKSLTGGAFHKVNEAWDSMSESDYVAFSDKWISECHRILIDSGAIYVCASHHNLGQVLSSLSKSGFIVKNILTWEKPNAMPNMTRRTYTHSTEFIVWAVKGKGWTFNYEALKILNPETQRDGSAKMMRDVWRLPVVQGAERLRGENGRALHPTQKPEALVERCVAASSNPGDLVVDPFSGSGTTAVICARLQRDFIGYELEDIYIKASKARVRKSIRELVARNASVS
jgi:site-specific DNA-methyltransferase (adenine-specific)/modification methylase